MDIRCRKTTCKYNKDHTCLAKSILVDRKVLCSTYQLSEALKGKNRQQGLLDKAEDYSKRMFEKLSAVDSRYEQIGQRLMEPGVTAWTYTPWGIR